jgi:class 3 adenylate cyclase
VFDEPKFSFMPGRFSQRSADQRRDVEEVDVSAEDETGTNDFQDWAGGEQVTLAIVITDVVGSTAMGQSIRDEAMNEVRRTHFAQSRRFIAQFEGREIKTMGDSFMVAFKCVDAALDYAMALQKNPGHARLQIRAGIHIGLMHVEAGDVFGATVNFAARVADAIKDAGVRLSCRAKEDVENVGAAKHKHLVWVKHDDVVMKGFPGKFSLWAVQS